MTHEVTLAQDVYASGYFINPVGLKTAAVFKIGEIVFERSEDGRDYYSSSIVVDTVNDDIYWSCNSNPINDISRGYGRVMKNDEVLLDNVIGTRINTIAFDGNDIYSAGYTNDIFEPVAAVWKNGDTIPLYTYGNMGKRSEVLGMVVVDGNVYACGYYEDIFRYGCVWVNGELYACYPHNAVRAIDYCEGGIYYAVGDLTSTIYKSGYELYELYTYDGKTNWVDDLKAFGGDVYSVGFVGYNDCFVWKNADYLYIHAFGREANFNACYFDGHSLYYVG